jgi:hypothetical protein
VSGGPTERVSRDMIILSGTGHWALGITKYIPIDNAVSPHMELHYGCRMGTLNASRESCFMIRLRGFGRFE